MKNSWSIDKIQDLWYFATKIHDGQKYGGPNVGEKIEYLNHIGSIAFEIINAAVNSENFDAEFAISCAILHDTIEDSEITYENINEKFGKKIANGVLALTKNQDLNSKEEKMNDSLKRIKLQPKEIWAVKMADRITNLYSPPYYWNNDKKKSYLEEAKLIYLELNEANQYLAERLKTKIENYQKFIK